MLLVVLHQIMVHVGSLKSTQKARIALGYHLEQLLRFFRSLQASCVHHNSMDRAKA